MFELFNIIHQPTYLKHTFLRKPQNCLPQPQPPPSPNSNISEFLIESAFQTIIHLIPPSTPIFPPFPLAGQVLPIQIYKQIKIKKNIVSTVKMSQFYSIVHEQKFYKIRYPTSDNRPNKKYSPSKMKSQQPYKGRHLADNTQKAYEFPVRNYSDFPNEASKSESFINSHARLSLSRLEKERITLRKINAPLTDADPDSQTRSDLLEEKCNQSLQFLVGPKNNTYKTQYSKIARRKETIIKRNLLIEEGERTEPKNRPFLEFSEQKLIQKYRELMQQGRPLNLINKLYQNDILSTKLMPFSTKEKLMMTRLDRNEREIEDKISRIVSKPSEYDTIRKMLLNMHDQIEEVNVYPYLTKDGLTRNETELIEERKTTAIESPEKKESPVKRTSLASQPFKNQRFSKQDQILSLPRKMESDCNIQAPVLKQPILPPKKVSCSAYIVYEVLNSRKQKLVKKIAAQITKKKEYQNNLHAGYNIKIASEIASLTKIMTCLIVIEICEKYSINPTVEKYKTGTFESFVHGTSAEVEPGEIYTIHQLLHGLMLPSGNDASLALARWGGNILLLNDFQSSKRGFNKLQLPSKSEIFAWAEHNKYIRSQEEKLRAKRCYNRFIAEMNKKARLLSMDRTTYANSHGLSNALNKSCCLDLAVLCSYAIQNSYFKQIVSCKQFACTIEKEICASDEMRSTRRQRGRNLNYDPEEMNLQADAQDQQTFEKGDYDEQDLPELKQEKKVQYTQKQIHWTNTHKLLHENEEYLGIKTGVTITAGPCLASYLQLKERRFIIIVLNSKRLIQRFIDTEILKNWLVKKQKLKSQAKLLQLPQGSKVKFPQQIG